MHGAHDTAKARRVTVLFACAKEGGHSLFVALESPWKLRYTLPPQRLPSLVATIAASLVATLAARLRPIASTK